MNMYLFSYEAGSEIYIPDKKYPSKSKSKNVVLGIKISLDNPSNSYTVTTSIIGLDYLGLHDHIPVCDHVYSPQQHIIVGEYPPYVSLETTLKETGYIIEDAMLYGGIFNISGSDSGTYTQEYVPAAHSIGIMHDINNKIEYRIIGRSALRLLNISRSLTILKSTVRDGEKHLLLPYGITFKSMQGYVDFTPPSVSITYLINDNEKASVYYRKLNKVLEGVVAKHIYRDEYIGINKPYAEYTPSIYTSGRLVSNGLESSHPMPLGHKL